MLNKKNVKVASDLIYTVMAAVVMNIALQLIIYPLITKWRGNDVAGSILYFIGFIYIIPQALSTTITNARLVLRKTHDTSNADYTHIILLFSLLSLVSVGFLGYRQNPSVPFALAYGLFSILYMLRSYAQVEFRLNLKFKEYFLYYCIISIGYLFGFGLYLLTDLWLLIFICGEAPALAYSLLRGEIFKKQKPMAPRSAVHKVIGAIALSTLIRDCVLHFDKVVLLETISPTSVTKYNAVSLIAKTMQMLTQPVNSLILSYLTVKGAVLSRKTLFKFSVIAGVVSVLFYGVCVIGTPLFLMLFYADIYDTVMPYNLLVNLGIILGFLASMFMSVLLSQGKTKTYSAIECTLGILYAVTAYYACTKFDLWGLVYTTLIMNIIKVILSLVVLFSTHQPTPSANEHTA